MYNTLTNQEILDMEEAMYKTPRKLAKISQFKIGKLSKFATKKKDCSPLFKFYMYFAKKLEGFNEDLHTVDVTQVKVNPKTYKELVKVVTDWGKVTNPYLKNKYLKSAVGMEMLCWGPCENDGVEEGIVVFGTKAIITKDSIKE